MCWCFLLICHRSSRLFQAFSRLDRKIADPEGPIYVSWLSRLIFVHWGLRRHKGRDGSVAQVLTLFNFFAPFLHMENCSKSDVTVESPFVLICAWFWLADSLWTKTIGCWECSTENAQHSQFLFFYVLERGKIIRSHVLGSSMYI